MGTSNVVGLASILRGHGNETEWNRRRGHITFRSVLYFVITSVEDNSVVVERMTFMCYACFGETTCERSPPSLSLSVPYQTFNFPSSFIHSPIIHTHSAMQRTHKLLFYFCKMSQQFWFQLNEILKLNLRFEGANKQYVNHLPFSISVALTSPSEWPWPHTNTHTKKFSQISRRENSRCTIPRAICVAMPPLTEPTDRL